jgi:hypothetical protein
MGKFKAYMVFMLAALIMIMTAAFVTPAFADDTWATYINERFGYSV